MPSLKLSNLLRRGDRRPSLKERAAALKASATRVFQRRPDAGTDQGRRAMVAGSLAAALPLPALAQATAAPHPDAELLALADRLGKARIAEAAADRAYLAAWETVSDVLAERPDALLIQPWEARQFLSPFAWPRWGNVYHRWTPPREPDEDLDHQAGMIWTGKALRRAIARAVPAMGQGGQTPHRIRHWKALLPIADAFDARVQAVEAAADYHGRSATRDAARKEKAVMASAVSDSVAHTPEGLAALVSVVAEYTWKDTGGAWPNLLRSAANVAAVDPASLEHEYASTRARRA